MCQQLVIPPVAHMLLARWLPMKTLAAKLEDVFSTHDTGVLLWFWIAKHYAASQYALLKKLLKDVYQSYALKISSNKLFIFFDMGSEFVVPQQKQRKPNEFPPLPYNDPTWAGEPKNDYYFEVIKQGSVLGKSGRISTSKVVVGI